MFNRDKVLPKLAELPLTPGVYIMKDAAGTVIYVGKAVNLKRRVSQYFGESKKLVKVMAMVNHVDSFDYVLTKSEIDALTLEATLIKKYMPRYNILLKDDKGRGSFIRVNRKEKYPSIELTRHVKKDGAKYYGPFAFGISAKLLYEAAKTAYGIRSCHGDPEKKKRECLDYQIGLCPAPCTGKVTPEQYAIIVDKTEKLLNGHTEEAEDIISLKMMNAASAEDFERAIYLRGLNENLKKISGRRLLNLNMEDSDIFAYASDGLKCAVNVMMVRGNKLLPAGTFFGDELEGPYEMMSSFIMQYYEMRPKVRSVYVNTEGDFSGLSEALSDDITVSITVPLKGQKHDLVISGEKNALEAIVKCGADEERRREQTVGAADRIAEILKIPDARRIECYDISHISGTDKVASGVCFINGEKSSENYRRYKIKTVEGNNDFACMAEVLSRRLERAKQGDESFTEMPTLILIDGGLGQLHYAYDTMKEKGFDIPMVSLAEREEEIYTIYSNEPIVLPRTDAALKLLQRVRDEAHRFAITYHRSRRIKRIKSELDEIPGIGEVKSKLLLKKYGSVSNIRVLPLEVLENVKGMDRKAAMAVYTHFHPEEK